jgi:hypothetical protein
MWAGSLGVRARQATAVAGKTRLMCGARALATARARWLSSGAESGADSAGPPGRESESACRGAGELGRLGRKAEGRRSAGCFGFFFLFLIANPFYFNFIF